MMCELILTAAAAQMPQEPLEHCGRLSYHDALFPWLLCPRFAMDTCPVTTRTDPQAPLLFCLSFFWPHRHPGGKLELWFLSVMVVVIVGEMKIKVSPHPTLPIFTFQSLFYAPKSESHLQNYVKLRYLDSMM